MVERAVSVEGQRYREEVEVERTGIHMDKWLNLYYIYIYI